MNELRLTDPDGYTVPGSIRTTTVETDAETRSDLHQLATEHAAEWADFGYDAREYRVV